MGKGSAMADGVQRHNVHSAVLVSTLSVLWTIVSSALAVVIGLRSRTSVLVAFGAVGIVDAIGSITLVYHFAHGLRHDRLSEEIERLAHRIVLIGLLVVGSAAAIGGVSRLVTGQFGSSSNGGVVLAAVSFVALLVLSARKRQVASWIPSSALRSDGHLSAVGAMLAAVALAGTAIEHWLSWHWADAGATIVVGCLAIALATSSWRSERHKSSQLLPSGDLSLRTSFNEEA